MNLDFGKLDGLVAAVIQDHSTNRVLMVGFMNEEAFRRTVETGFVTFFSRSRNKLWIKGETSGHRLKVASISTDCDRDALLRARLDAYLNCVTVVNRRVEPNIHGPAFQPR